MSEQDLAVVEKQEIQVNHKAPPMVQIAQMMQAGVKIDVDQMAKFQEMGERFEANEARKSFAADFTKVQANIAAVIKTKDNKQTHSKYAGLDDVINMAKPVYTEQGFSVIFYEGVTDVPENIRVCADVLHRSGHEKTYHFDVPLDGVGIKGNANMTKIHGKASSVSYGKRYLMCMIWNIPTADDDGNGGPDKVEVFQEPIGNQKKAVDKAFDTLLDSVPDGKSLNWDKLCKFLVKRWTVYPSDEDQGKNAALTIVAEKLINLVCEDKK